MVMYMTAPLHQRFDQKVHRTEGCWLWTGALGGGKWDGRYGQIKHAGRTLAAHRVSFELHKGEVPAGMHVMHRCDNPRCVNPEHLSLGTHLDNMRDMYSKGRRVAATGLRSAAGKLSDGQKAFIRSMRDVPAHLLADPMGVSSVRINQIRRESARRN